MQFQFCNCVYFGGSRDSEREPALLSSPRARPAALLSGDDVETGDRGSIVLALDWEDRGTVPLGSGHLVAAWARLPRRLADSPQNGKSPPGPRSHQPPQASGHWGSPHLQPHLSLWPFGPAAAAELSSSLSSQSQPVLLLWELVCSVLFLSPGGGLLSSSGFLPKAEVSVALKSSAVSSSHRTRGGSQSVPGCSLSTRESCSTAPRGAGDDGMGKMDAKLENLPRRMSSPCLLISS